MRSTGFKTILLGLLVIAPWALAGCDDKGPAQKAGQSVDTAATKLKDAIDPPGPIEKAGRAIDKATGN